MYYLTCISYKTGDRLYTISSDKSIQCLDISSNSCNHDKQLLYLPNAHNCPINKIINVSENVIATGDDNGNYIYNNYTSLIHNVIFVLKF